ncbi:MAG: hypothetical protein LQ338_002590, partial [Usnochroma carphineum]
MPAPGVNKKRLASRALSPTHKRRKSVRSIYDQNATDTQPSAPQFFRRGTIAENVSELHCPEVPELAPTKDSLRNDYENASSVVRQADAPYAPPSNAESLPRPQDLESLQAKSSTTGRGVCRPSSQTHDIVTRTRPLPADADTRAVNAQNNTRIQARSRSSHRYSASDMSAIRDRVLRVREKRTRAAKDHKATITRIEPPPETRSRITHRFLASETLAIRDNVLKAREKRTRATRKRGIKKGKRPAAKSVSAARKAARLNNWLDISPSTESSVLSNSSSAPSPLDLGSPVSDKDVPSKLSLRAPCTTRVSSDGFPAGQTRRIDGNQTVSPPRKLANERVFSGDSEQHGPFERSGCPSPTPSLLCEKCIYGSYPCSDICTEPALHTTGPNGSLLKFMPAYKAVNGNQRVVHPWNNGRCGQQKSKMTEPCTLGAPDPWYNEPSATDLDVSEDISLEKSLEAPVSSARLKDDECGPNSYIAGVTRLTIPLLDYWRHDSLQFEAPAPLMVYTLITEGMAATQDTQVDEDVDMGTRDARSQSGHDGTSEPRITPQGTVSQIQGPSNDNQWLERFPDLSEDDLRYSHSTTNASSSAMDHSQNLSHRVYQSTGNTHSGQLKSPRTRQNSIIATADSNQQAKKPTDGTNSRPVSEASRPPTRSTGAGRHASATDPSIQAGVYHAMTLVTSRTPEPTLDPRQEESEPFRSRNTSCVRRQKRASTSDHQQSVDVCRQSTDSEGIVKPDIDAVFRQGTPKYPPHDLRNTPILKNLLSVSADTAGEPSSIANDTSTVPTAAPPHDQRVNQTTLEDPNGVSAGASDEIPGAPAPGPASIPAMIQAPGLTLGQENDLIQQHTSHDQARQIPEGERKREQAEQKKSEDIQGWIPSPLQHGAMEDLRPRKVGLGQALRQTKQAAFYVAASRPFDRSAVAVSHLGMVQYLFISGKQTLPPPS